MESFLGGRSYLMILAGNGGKFGLLGVLLPICCVSDHGFRQGGRRCTTHDHGPTRTRQPVNCRWAFLSVRTPTARRSTVSAATWQQMPSELEAAAGPAGGHRHADQHLARGATQQHPAGSASPPNSSDPERASSERFVAEGSAPPARPLQLGPPSRISARFYSGHGPEPGRPGVEHRGICVSPGSRQRPPA